MTMRKILSILLVVTCLFMLGGCKGNVEEQQEQRDILEPYFTGKVLEKYDESCLVEVTDAGNGNIAVGQQVVVHMNVPNCPDYAVGDLLTISFDGKMTCSLPPQVVGIAILVQHG